MKQSIRKEDPMDLHVEGWRLIAQLLERILFVIFVVVTTTFCAVLWFVAHSEVPYDELKPGR